MKKWKKDKLENVATRITKGSTPTTYGYKFLDKGIPFVKVENLANGRIDKDSINQYISDDAHEFQKRSQLTPGDILFSIAGTIGRVALVQIDDVPANTNQAVAIIRGTKKRLKPTFLRILLDSHISSKVVSKARGGAMNNISLSDLKDMEVILPEFNEQEQIIDTIETQFTRLDAAIKFLKEIKDKLRVYRKSVLKSAFNGTLSNSFPIGSKRISDVAILKSGTGFPKIYQNKHGLDYGFYKVGDISKAWLAKSIYLLEPQHEISKNILLKIRGNLIPASSIVFAKIGEALKLNRRAVTRNNCLVDNNVFALTPRKKVVDMYFLYYFMFTIDFTKNSRATTVPSLRKEDVESIEIPTYSLKDQTKIVEEIESRFSVIDKIGEVVDKSLKKAERLRKSILKAVFEGKLVN